MRGADESALHMLGEEGDRDDQSFLRMGKWTFRRLPPDWVLCVCWSLS